MSNELNEHLSRTRVTLAIMRRKREQGGPVVITCQEYRDLKAYGVAADVLKASNVILTIGDPALRYSHKDGGWHAN